MLVLKHVIPGGALLPGASALSAAEAGPKLREPFGGELLFSVRSQGTTGRLRTGRGVAMVAKCKVDERLRPSPAALGNALFLDTPGFLCRIESKS